MLCAAIKNLSAMGRADDSTVVVKFLLGKILLACRCVPLTSHHLLSSRTRHQPLPLRHPRLWASWLALGLIWLLVRLPVGWLSTLGRACGRIAWFLAPGRRQIACRNIELCFPELSAEQGRRLAQENFSQLGMAAMESAWSWLGRQHLATRYLDRFNIEGFEHYTSALALGRGVIVLGVHLMAIDVIGPALLAQRMHLNVIYRYNKNPVIEQAIKRGRERFYPRAIEREDTRGIVSALKSGEAIWYAADQDYGKHHSVFPTFFGVQAATITGTMRLARLRNSPVLLLSQYREPNHQSWKICFSPVLDRFPSDDPLADTQRVNDLLENAIKKAPAQYLWLHRRFKTRPSGEPGLY